MLQIGALEQKSQTRSFSIFRIANKSMENSCGKGGAHTLHRSLQRFTDVAHSGKVLLRHLCQLRVHLAVLRFQLLTQPFLPFCIVPVCGRLCRAIQQQGHHQADGHQKHRVKKR